MLEPLSSVSAPFSEGRARCEEIDHEITKSSKEERPKRPERKKFRRVSMEIIELSGARSELVVVVLPGRRQKSVVRGRGGEGGERGKRTNFLSSTFLSSIFLSSTLKSKRKRSTSVI